MKILKNSEYLVKIEDLTYEGFGLCKINGFSVFVENALVDEEVLIKIIKVCKNYAIGKVIEHIKKSNDRVDIIDKKAMWIATMPLQHLKYDKQLLFKRKQVENVIKNIAKIDVEVDDVIGCSKIVEYRNKAQIPVREIDGVLTTGFYRKNTHNLIEIEDFIIQDKVIDKTIIIVRDIFRKYNIKAYDEINNEGILRHIVVRKGHYTNEVQIILVTTVENFKFKSEVVSEIVNSVKNLVSLILNVNNEITNVIMGKVSKVLYGDNYYTDYIFNKKFKIGSNSFYQVNSVQMEVLYSKVIEIGEFSKEDVLIDAYCGIGSIGISVADKVKFVYGMEIVEEAIQMAKENAVLNGLKNMEFEAGSADVILNKWKDKKVDVIIVDPPRKGLDIDFINTSVSMNPKKIIYVSCNPATLARDLGVYDKLGYKCVKVSPVDMFPQSVHVECVALLSKLDVDKYIDVEIKLDELDLTSAESKTTYT